MIDVNYAKRSGYKVTRLNVEPEPDPEPPAPLSVQVTVENTGLVDALAALEPKIVEIVQNQDIAEAFMNALEQSTRAVIYAANKIPAKQFVDSAELTHEYDVQSRMPVIKTIKFNYRDVE